MNKFLKFWGPAIVWMGIIFTLSAIPNLKIDLKEDFLLRKIAHMVEFGILTWLFLRAISASKAGRSPQKAIIYSIIFSLFYALIDEYHQTLVSGRHGSLIDASIDGIGILLASTILYIKNKK
jgi:VanZ family protein